MLGTQKVQGRDVWVYAVITDAAKFPKPQRGAHLNVKTFYHVMLVDCNKRTGRSRNLPH